MIVKIPDDIYSYEPKLFGNFTVRQVICVSISLGIITGVFIPLFLATHDTTMPGFLASMLGVPVMYSGLIRKDGLPFEKYLYLKIKSKSYPSKRPFRMHNLYEDLNTLEKEMTSFDKEYGEETEK